MNRGYQVNKLAHFDDLRLEDQTLGFCGRRAGACGSAFGLRGSPALAVVAFESIG